MKPKPRVPMDDLTPPQDHLDIVATRRWDEQPERWSTTVTIDERKLDLGSFPSVGQALCQRGAGVLRLDRASPSAAQAAEAPRVDGSSPE